MTIEIRPTETITVPSFASRPDGASLVYVNAQLALKAPLASPAFTGHPTGQTEAPGNDSNRLATTAFVETRVDGEEVIRSAGDAALQISINLKANLDGPHFTGIPTVLHPSDGVDNNQIPSTAWVRDRIEDYLVDSPTLGGIPTTGYPSAGSDNLSIPTTSWTRDRIDEGVAAGKVSPAFSGIPTTPYPTASADDTKIPTTAWTRDRIDDALEASPVLGGIPTVAGHPSAGANNFQIPSTAWVVDRVDAEVDNRVACDLAIGTQVNNLADELRAADDDEIVLRAAADSGLGVSINNLATELRDKDDELEDNFLKITRSNQAGEFVKLFSTSVAGGEPRTLPQVSTAAVVLTSDEGWAVEVAETKTARREKFYLAPNRKYRSRYMFRRSVNTPDPANDAVAPRIAWFTSSKNPVTSHLSDDAVDLDAAGLYDLSTGDEWQTIETTVSRSAGAGVTIVAPSTARFATPYVQTFGPVQRTRIKLIDWQDVTDQSTSSPDLDDLENRTAGLESIDSGNRLDVLEAGGSAPTIRRLTSNAAAIADTVPLTVDILELLGIDNEGDSLTEHLRVVSEPTHGGKVQSADGQWWEASVPVYDVVNVLRDRLRGEATLDLSFVAALADLDPAAGGVLDFAQHDYDYLDDLVVGPNNVNVTIAGRGWGTRFIRPGVDVKLFDVGAGAAQGVRVKGFQARDFWWEGDGGTDSDDGFAGVCLRYTDGARVKNIGGKNGSSLIRIGHGDLAWPLADQRCLDTEVEGCYAENMQYFCVEAHGHKGTRVHDNRAVGGARSTDGTNAAYRSVQGYDAVFSHNQSDGMGKGALMTGGSADLQEAITWVGNQFRNQSYGQAMDLHGPIKGLRVIDNDLFGCGSSEREILTISGNLVAYVDNPIVHGNKLYGNLTTLIMMLLKQVGRGDIKGNKLLHELSGRTDAAYAIQFEECGGLFDASGNQIVMDHANHVAFKSLNCGRNFQATAFPNTISLPGVAPFTGKAFDGNGFLLHGGDFKGSQRAITQIYGVEGKRRKWRAEWFGVIDSASVDQVPALDKIIAAYDPAEGPIDVAFPPYRIALNNGGSNVPWKINKDGVTLSLQRDTRIIKTVADRVIIHVGKTADMSQGDRVQGFSIIGPGTLDGGSVVDTSDNWPMLWMQYVQDGLVEGVYFKDASNCLRFGDGDLSWPLDDQRTKRMRVKGCNFTNFRWFGCEMFGADVLTVSDNFYEGGVLNNYTDNLPIRPVKCRDITIESNKIAGCGRGISTSTTTLQPGVNYTYVNNIIRGCTVGPAISNSGPTDKLSIIGGIIDGTGDGVGLGPSLNLTQAVVLGVVTNAQVMGLFVKATSPECTDLIRFDDLVAGKVSGCTFINVGNGGTGTKYVARFVGSAGLVEFSNNYCHWDVSLGLADVLGVSGLQLIAKHNTMKGPSVGTVPATAFSQSASAGTLLVNDNHLIDA